MAAPLLVDRYAIYDRIAAGGMATVHLGRLVGERGFSRTVAIKRLHPHLALDPDFVSMFLDEARLAARIRHPNVVQTLDVVVGAGGSEVFLVMEYVEGESMAALLRVLTARGETMAPEHAAALIGPVLHGLHAAHDAKNDHGEPLALVHRDVSPQNVLVGVDGIPRVLDFGVAKALGQSHSTRAGEIKGKLAYMAPEQIEGQPVDRRTDVFAAGIVLWEALAGRRLFKGDGDARVMRLVLHEPIAPPSRLAPGVSPALDHVVMTSLSRDPSARYATAELMADALEEAVHATPARKVAVWVQGLFGDRFMARAKLVREIESASTGGTALPREASAPRLAAEEIVDVSIFASPDPMQSASQASGISVETPLRASIAPRRSPVAPLGLVVGGAISAVCLGVAALVVATRGSGAPPEAPVAATSQTAPTATLPPPPVATTTLTLPPVTPAPTVTATSPPRPTATTPRPLQAASPGPPPVPHPGAAPQPRPPGQRGPAPASTLYSRF